MATYLCDTNLLLRLADPASPQHAVAAQALARLFSQKDEVYLTAQNFIEFWAVATRPVDANGLGWTRERTLQEVTDLRGRFPLLLESPSVFSQWLELVRVLSISGKRVHDARLVAVMKAHQVEHLLTFNAADFNAFPALSVVTPQPLVAT